MLKSMSRLKANSLVAVEERCRDFRRMEKALAWLAEHFATQPSLEEAAEQLNLSEFHFQRLFTRWVGVSPKQYVRCLTLDRAKASLADGKSVLDAAFDAGLSSPGRLHDLFVQLESVTPGEYKRRGQNMVIQYGFHPSPFGEVAVATTERGIVALNFLTQNNPDEALSTVRKTWANADFVQDDNATGAIVSQAFGPAPPSGHGPSKPLKVLVRGTGFQVKVWQALIALPSGTVCSYQDLAMRVNEPTASRAVANAVANNLVGYLIPCHRVIRKNGGLGGYRLGHRPKARHFEPRTH